MVFPLVPLWGERNPRVFTFVPLWGERDPRVTLVPLRGDWGPRVFTCPGHLGGISYMWSSGSTKVGGTEPEKNNESTQYV